MNANEAVNPAIQQEMTLHSACLPPLVAGTYTVEVQQTVKHEDKEISGKAGEQPTFEKTITFEVLTPRFSLAPGEIYHRHPAADAKGTFSAMFPHIVLSRRTLPWERKLENDDLALPRPWLALVLLDEDELGPQRTGTCGLRQRAVKELAKNDRALAAESEQCLTLELPFAQFQQIAPAWEDLPYLAHVREVGNTNAMEAAGIDDHGWFSVVVCNRLPRPGKENHVFLVSLEGLEACLPGGLAAYPPERRPAAQPTNVTLTVLANWRFVDEVEGKSFSQLVAGLTRSPLRLRPGPGAKLERPREDIESALQFGYVPLLHQTGEGYRTVSWYRGPLVPHFLPTDSRNKVYPSAGAALRYDENQGLFDVSYAAAWQLGRLLGLQNQPFARALCRMKLGVVQEAAQAMLSKSLQQRFGKPGDWKEWEKLVRTLFKPPDPGSPSRASGSPPQGDTASEHCELLREELMRQKVEIPPDIRQWLARLFLLHGVPVNYLVPHPALLPEESLRFFYLDTTWVAAMMDGALSIGRTAESQLHLDKAMAGNFLKDVATGEKINSALTLDKDIGIPNPNDTEILGHITGFLLRSELVSGWKGVEINAEDRERSLSVLRLQRITGNTLLAIFNGQIRKLTITQPPQGLHFGVSDEIKNAPDKWRDSTRVLRFRVYAGNQMPTQFAAEKLLQMRRRLIINLDVKGT
jgi:hypothetical protein